MTKNDFILRMAMDLMSEYRTKLTPKVVRNLAASAKGIADILEGEGITFDACQGGEKDDSALQEPDFE